MFDISKNNIGQNGGKSIFETLSNKNDTIESLGAYETYFIFNLAIRE